MKKKLDSPGKRVIRKVRKVAHDAGRSVTTRHVLPTPPSELRHTPQLPMLLELRKEAAHLREELAHQEVLTQDHPTSGNHMADDASEVFEQTKNLALKRHLERKLEQVELAIHRWEKGVYGICERCGRAISPERLEVMPYATTCVDCAKLVPHPA
jgi:RNA polymerase-binding transcription factor DksA